MNLIMKFAAGYHLGQDTGCIIPVFSNLSPQHSFKYGSSADNTRHINVAVPTFRKGRIVKSDYTDLQVAFNHLL
jgi:hypothetical protein